jgi:two-component system phosphate regulon response regulator PhoB
MIMPKNRELTGETGGRLRPSRAVLKKEDGERTIVSGGRASVDVKSRSVELAFSLPFDQGMEIVERLRAGAACESAPILLWAGSNGALTIELRKPASGSNTSARATVGAERKPPPVSARPDMECISIGDLVINPGRHEVLYKGKPIPQLTFTEFGILHFLARHPGWVFNRAQIVAGVRGEEYPVTDRAVDVQVAGLRKKLGEAAVCVQTVRGVGYRFRD